MRTLGLALAVALLWTGQAEARREQTYAYPFSRVWNAAVRMLRVDFDSPITEKDKDSGYFLFDYPDSGKQHPGSVEVIRVQDNGVEAVRVVMQLPAMPTYVEQMMLDHLARKLGQEYGPPRAPKSSPDAVPEHGAESDSNADGAGQRQHGDSAAKGEKHDPEPSEHGKADGAPHD